MKKIFTLVVAALIGGVIGANAQQKYWDLSTWSSVDVTGGTSTTVTEDGLTYYCQASSAYSAGNATIEVKGESLNFTGRIKFGGKSTFKESSMSRVFSFSVNSGEQIYVFGAHGSTSGTRTFYLSMAPSTVDRDITTAFASKPLVDGERGYLSTTAPSTGTAYLWADDNNGVYAISVGYSLEELVELQAATAINNITTNAVDAAAPIYNLAGQQVSKDYKGVCIQNGRKFINK